MARIAVTGLRGVPASWGGVERHCEEIYSRLASKGHEITIYARNYYVNNEVRFYKGMHVKRLPTINRKYTDTALHTFFSVLHTLFTRPDIIHFHALGPCLFSWMPRVLRPSTRIFFTCHGLDWQRKKWPSWASKIIRVGEWCAVHFPHYRIVVSKELQNYFSTRYGVRTHYIPNGIVKPQKQVSKRITQFRLAERDYLLFVARIVPEKRLEDIIRAFIDKPRKSKLVIVGESADTKLSLDHYKGIAQGRPSVLFLGYQYGEVLNELYSNARSFITASELEGLPLTLLEAISYGLPCIASDIEPHREILGEHLSSLMFGVGDLATLSKRIDEVENLSREELDQYGKTALADIGVRFNWDTIADILHQLYVESFEARLH